MLPVFFYTIFTKKIFGPKFFLKNFSDLKKCTSKKFQLNNFFTQHFLDKNVLTQYFFLPSTFFGLFFLIFSHLLAKFLLDQKMLVQKNFRNKLLDQNSLLRKTALDHIFYPIFFTLQKNFPLNIIDPKNYCDLQFFLTQHVFTKILFSTKIFGLFEIKKHSVKKKFYQYFL